MSTNQENDRPDRTGQFKHRLHKLTHDHADGILFAEEISRIAERGTDEELKAGFEKVRQYNIDELEAHLQHEEQCILRPLVQYHPEHTPLCITIGKEHGFIRTLVEHMTPDSARDDLAEFGRVLKKHTLLEDQQLLPLVAELFTDEQIDEIADFTPLARHNSPDEPTTSKPKNKSHNDEEWLTVAKQHLNRTGKYAGCIVLYPRYSPELSKLLATHLDLEFFDYQSMVMEKSGSSAASITLDQLNVSLRHQSEKAGIVSHNVEALLCVKSAGERRDWIQDFLDTKWPNPVFLPIAVFQAEVPSDHRNVCDLELHKMSWRKIATDDESKHRIKYDID